MSGPTPLTLPADPEVARHAAARAVIGGQVGMLTRLAQIGMGIAEDAGRRSAELANGETAKAGETDPGLTYARAARAVRLTLALQTQLLKDLETWGRPEGHDRTWAPHYRRLRIQRIVDRTIEAEHAGKRETERLRGEARERLIENEDDFGDMLDRPIGEIVAAICADLGLSPDWGAGVFGGEEAPLAVIPESAARAYPGPRGSSAAPSLLGPGSPLRYGRDDKLFRPPPDPPTRPPPEATPPPPAA